jgi:Ca2+-binding EF-hand superfamily protein
LKSTFSLFTKNENKNIHSNDFKHYLGLQSKFTERQWEMIIKNVDKDGNGNVIYILFSKKFYIIRLIILSLKK